MTTTVKVTAHNFETSVKVRKPDGELIREVLLKDGEEDTFIVTNMQHVQVSEVTQPTEP
jgi:hypothetical protein